MFANDNLRRPLMSAEQHRRKAKLYRERPEIDPDGATLADHHEKLADAFERGGYYVRSAPDTKEEP